MMKIKKLDTFSSDNVEEGRIDETKKKNGCRLQQEMETRSPLFSFSSLADLKGVFFSYFLKIRETILLFSRAYPKEEEKEQEEKKSPFSLRYLPLCTGKHERRKEEGVFWWGSRLLYSPKCHTTKRNETKRKK